MNEYLIHAFNNNLIKKENRIKENFVTMVNAQANSILESVHRIIANLVRILYLQNKYQNKDEPWSGILAATDFAVNSTYQSKLQVTPCQLVFGRDMI